MNKQVTGVDSPITNLIERGLTSFWRVLKVSYIEKNHLYRLQFGYKSCFLFTNVAFRVQNLRFAYKYLIVNLQNCISNYKVASRNAIQPYQKNNLFLYIYKYNLTKYSCIVRLKGIKYTRYMLLKL